MMQFAPLIHKTSIAEKARLGPYQTHLHDAVKPTDGTEYRYVLLVRKAGDLALAITAERPADAEEYGLYFLAVDDGSAKNTLMDLGDMREIEVFRRAAVQVAREYLGLDDAEYGLAEATTTRPRPLTRTLRLECADFIIDVTTRAE